MVGNGWIYLGEYYFNAGSSADAGAVVVSNLLGSAEGAYTFADAIRFGAHSVSRILQQRNQSGSQRGFVFDQQQSHGMIGWIGSDSVKQAPPPGASFTLMLPP